MQSYFEIILNFCHLAMNAIHDLPQRWHGWVLGFVPNKPTTTKTQKFDIGTLQSWSNIQHRSTDTQTNHLVRYESTGTPSTVRALLSPPDTLSSSSICLLILWDTPSTKLFDCTLQWIPHHPKKIKKSQSHHPKFQVNKHTRSVLIAETKMKKLICNKHSQIALYR